ncbi:hypothetical protein CVT24_001890 [Panaeolus cyanescens]|uniref:F-box domain-containing protein n=1 Tax=Panaeolus cyanescens TaxID=181874 RepID=A0A409YEV2_9AGAR|nr:hypothetical protein CVT24_001890 [Panaeolus cyanescens]
MEMIDEMPSRQSAGNIIEDKTVGALVVHDKDFMDSSNSKRATFSDMPAELIGEVLLYLASGKGRSPTSTKGRYSLPYDDVLAASATSKLLRDIARSTRKLWARVLSFRRSEASIRQCLDLSYPLPLRRVSMPHFACHSRYCIEGRSPSRNNPLWGPWALLLEQDILTTRCSSLKLGVDFCMWIWLNRRLGSHFENLQELDISFTLGAVIEWHPEYSAAFPPISFSKKVIFSRLEKLTLRGGFFAMNPSSYPSLKSLTVEMAPEETRGHRGFGYGRWSSVRYRNWRASTWRQLLASLPTLEAVSLTNVIRTDDTLPSAPPLEPVCLSNIKSLKIKDAHACIARFFESLTLSPTCALYISSTVSMSDLAGPHPLDERVVTLLRDRYSSPLETSCFGKIGRCILQERPVGKREPGLVPCVWDLEVGNVRELKTHVPMTPLSLKFTFAFPRPDGRWKKRAFFLLNQLLVDALATPLQETQHINVMLNIREVQKGFHKDREYKYLTKFVKGLAEVV